MVLTGRAALEEIEVFVCAGREWEGSSRSVRRILPMERAASVMLVSDVCPLRGRLSGLARRAILHTRSDRFVANGKSGVPRRVDPARKLPTGHEAMGTRQSWGDAGG